MRFVIDHEFLDKASRSCGFCHYTGKLVRHGVEALEGSGDRKTAVVNPVHGGWLGEGGSLARAGVPTIGYIPQPNYLLAGERVHREAQRGEAAQRDRSVCQGDPQDGYGACGRVESPGLVAADRRHR